MPLVLPQPDASSLETEAKAHRMFVFFISTYENEDVFCRALLVICKGTKYIGKQKGEV